MGEVAAREREQADNIIRRTAHHKLVVDEIITEAHGAATVCGCAKYAVSDGNRARRETRGASRAGAGCDGTGTGGCPLLPIGAAHHIVAVGERPHQEADIVTSRGADQLLSAEITPLAPVAPFLQVAAPTLASAPRCQLGLETT